MKTLIPLFGMYYLANDGMYIPNKMFNLLCFYHMIWLIIVIFSLMYILT